MAISCVNELGVNYNLALTFSVDLISEKNPRSKFSVYETVRGLGPPQNEYFGHGSWIYFFNDQVSGVQDNEAILAGEDFDPSDATLGGHRRVKVNGKTYLNIFQWLNDQVKE